MSLTLPPPKAAGTKCWYAQIELPEDEREQVDGWMADLEIDGSRIAGALAAYNVTAAQVNNHRRNHVIPRRPCR